MIIGYIQLIAFAISLITVIAVSPGSGYVEWREWVSEPRGHYTYQYEKITRIEKDWPLNDGK